MKLEEAIKTALNYENRIRNLYEDAARNTTDPVAGKIFRLLAEDEQNHIAYLENRLNQWQKTGEFTVEELDSVLPPTEAIRRELAELKERMAQDDRKDEKQMMSKALQVEVETSRFYETMVDQLSGDGRRMFARFLQIENEHIDIVQAELDYLSHTGYWFDIKEFDME